MSDEKTTIEAAALRLGGKVHSLPQPARHHDIIQHLTATGMDPGSIAMAEQGFITSEGQFVCRRPALRIAREAGQIKWRETASGHGLFSEDVW